MRGILMIEPLYHQTVAGNKTQTRRTSGLEMINDCLEENYQPTEWRDEWYSNPKKTVRVLEFMRPGIRSTVIQCQPRYKIDEVLYIKEPFLTIRGFDTRNVIEDVVYKYPTDIDSKKIKWGNKMFMPAEAARAFIRIAGIKCERLQDISDNDCVAEGIEAIGDFKGVTTYKNYQPNVDNIPDFMQPGLSFFSLYRFANKTKVTGNPWVWVYTYEYLPDYKI